MNSALAKNESGSVLIVLALSLSVIILFIALGVDTARLGSSHQRQSRTAELGALAAVETFLANPRDPVNGDTARLELARLRAEQVVGLPSNSITAQHATQSNTGEIGNSVTAGDRGALIPGQYYFNEPAIKCSTFDQSLNNPSTGPEACPCPGGAWKGECFRPHLSSAEWDGGVDDRPISAFKLDLFTSASSPVQSVFSHAGGGQKDFSLSSTAISTVTPRHVVFLIDLSGSMSVSSHLFPINGDFTTPPFSSVAFFVANCSSANKAGGTDFDGDGTIDRNCSYPGENPNAYFPNRVWQGGPVGAPDYPNWPTGMPECRNLNPTARENIFLHYRDDYKCYEIDKDGNPLTNDPEYFLVENGFYTDGSGRQRTDLNGNVYRGPEPLSTVLSGINETLESLSKLSVPGDQVTFIAYDHNVPTTGPRIIGPVSPGDTKFVDLLRLTDHDGVGVGSLDDIVDGLSEAIIDERIEHQLFTRPDAFTDLSEALLRAYVILSKSDGVEIADNQVVAFGDGLGNCPHSEGTVKGTANPVSYPVSSIATEFFLDSPSANNIDFVMPSKECNDSLDPSVPTEANFATAYGCVGGDIYDFTQPNCETAYNALNAYIAGLAYYKSTTEVKAMITGVGRPLLPSGSSAVFESFVKNGFKFHAFLFGDHIQPHTILRKGTNGCMTEAETRKLDLGYTDPGSAEAGISTSPYGASKDNPFIQPNYDFQNGLVQTTNGRYFSIRTPCSVAQLNTVPSTTGPVVTAANCSDGKGVERLDNFCKSQLNPLGNPYDVGDIIRVDIPGVIVNGRLICDPNCRGYNEQVTLGIGSLFEDNPIISVEAPPR